MHSMSAYSRHLAHWQPAKYFRPRTRRGGKWNLTLFAAAAANSARLFRQCKIPDPKIGDLMLALPIFTASRPATIVGVHELNFCVRDGNRWTLMTINTNSWRWDLTHLYVKTLSGSNYLLGDPYRIRTDVNGVRGRCLNHLTNGPLVHLQGLEPGTH